MAIDLNTVQNVSPSPATVSDSPLNASVSLTNATNVSPQPAPVDRITEAGISLTKIVLGILSAALFIFLTAIGAEQYQELNTFNELVVGGYKATNTIHPIPCVVADAQLLSKLSPILEQIHSIQKDPSGKKVRELTLQTADQLVQFGTLFGDAKCSDEIKAIAGDMRALYDDPAKQAINISKLIEVTRRADSLTEQSAPELSANSAEDLKNRQELFKTYADEAKSERDFLVQIGQLILINVLLPILTALLGYVFGSKQGRN